MGRSRPATDFNMHLYIFVIVAGRKAISRWVVMKNDHLFERWFWVYAWKGG